VTTRVGLGQVERTDRLVWTCAVHLIGKLHSKLRMLDVVESHWPELEGMMQELSGAAEAVTGMRPPAPRPLCLPSPRAPPEAGRSRRVLTRAGAAVAGVKPSPPGPPPPPLPTGAPTRVPTVHSIPPSLGRGAFQKVYAFHRRADYDGCAPRPPALPCRARALACRGDGLLSLAALAMPAAGAEPAGPQARS
jgi:hypothetical protein